MDDTLPLNSRVLEIDQEAAPSTRSVSESKKSAFIGVYRRAILMCRANAKLSE